MPTTPGPSASPTASSAAANSHGTESSSAQEEPRPQAEPLPSKLRPSDDRGSAPGQLGGPIPEINLPSVPPPVLNEGPHPAENRSTWVLPPPANSNPIDVPSASRSDDSHTTTLSSTQSSKYGVLLFLRTSKPNPKLGGISPPTLVRMILVLGGLGATIVGWVFSLAALRSSDDSSSDDQILKPDPPSKDMGNTSFIFVHVAFGTAILIVLILLHRAVLRVLDERFSWLHPGEIHPRLRHRAERRHRQQQESISRIAPWNRPPLPSYAVALGHRGTGDVEDDAIAVPPPPAYGNTRGSTLLLSGIRLTRSDSQRSHISSPSESPRVSRRMSIRNSIMSFISAGGSRRTRQNGQETDLEAGAVNDALRARKLEETLAKLEDGSKTPITSSKPPDQTSAQTSSSQVSTSHS